MAGEDSLDDLMVEWMEWFNESMPEADIDSFYLKFKEESGEFLEDPSVEEAVDSIMTAWRWAERVVGFEGVVEALRAKLTKNQGRRFVRMEDGTYHHVEEKWWH